MPEPTLEERLAALEATVAAHIESTGNDPYRISNLELAMRQLIAALRQFITGEAPVQ